MARCKRQVAAVNTSHKEKALNQNARSELFACLRHHVVALERFWSNIADDLANDCGATGDDFHIHQAAADYRRPARTDQQESPRDAETFRSTLTDLPTPSDAFSVEVSSKAVVMGRAGLEPATNGL